MSAKLHSKYNCFNCVMNENNEMVLLVSHYLLEFMNSEISLRSYFNSCFMECISSLMQFK